MTHSDEKPNKVTGKENIDVLSYLRAENPFKNDPKFLHKFRDYYEQMHVEPFSDHHVSLKIQDEIEELDPHSTESYKLVWLGHELFPDDTHFMARLMVHIRGVGRYEDLAMRLQRRIAKEDHNPRSVFDLAHTLSAYGQYEEAIKFIEYGLQEFDDADIVRYTGLQMSCEYSLGNYSRAKELLEVLMRDDPHDSRLKRMQVLIDNIVGSRDEPTKVESDGETDDLEIDFWFQAKRASVKGDMLEYKKALYKLMSLHSEPLKDYSLAFIASVRKSDMIEAHEQMILDSIREYFGEEEFSIMERESVRFEWWEAPKDMEHGSGAFTNVVWGGLYSNPRNSPAVEMLKTGDGRL